MIEYAVMAVMGTIAVGAGLGVVVSANPINSVMSLLLAMLALAGLYLALDAPVVALFQIIIYVGAILVLFLFAVMLLNLKKASVKVPSRSVVAGIGIAAVVLSFAVGGLLWRALRKARFLMEPEGPVEQAGLHDLARALFTEHLLLVELTAVLLLVASIGAIMISRKQEGR